MTDVDDGGAVLRVQAVEGSCVKCRNKRTVVAEVKMSRAGRLIARGPCPVCGAEVVTLQVPDP